ncbi:hypothetical protein ACM26V_00320 [Salipaludibacillus sp. HK11]|uniref:hypothetical protein n=1 Tax=Salipaludibacillus sp. HK11 TaxID=3394320 RepID=UPI0039FC41C3
MHANEFKQKLYTSHGLQLIVAGLARLVESEGYSPQEAFKLVEATKQNTFHSLAEIGREVGWKE